MINETWLNRSSDYDWLYSGSINGKFVAFQIHDNRSRASIYTKSENYALDDILHIERESLAELVEHIEQVYSVKIRFRNAPEEIIARAHQAKPEIKERFGLDNSVYIPKSPSRGRMKANLMMNAQLEQLALL